MAEGKLVHHRCGHVLGTEVAAVYPKPDGSLVIVVHYRDGSTGQMVWDCPGCGGGLVFHWSADGKPLYVSAYRRLDGCCDEWMES
jgi:hypothetical protein